ncbi:MAG: NUDIX domain-containing protein, partial [Dehalococcoidia bacterium]
RVLMMKWRDPKDQTLFWEPPGGGAEPDETPLETARRELTEETGLSPDVVTQTSMPVQRVFRYNGDWWGGPETFFLGRLNSTHTATELELTAVELDTLIEMRWLSWDELRSVPEPVEPIGFQQILVQLCPDGPWAHA